MKAHRDPFTDLLELQKPDADGKPVRVQGSPHYRRFCGGLAWFDPRQGDVRAKNGFLVVGEREDGVLVSFIEVLADMGDLSRQMIDWKDRLLINHIYLSDDQEESLRELRNVDGLSRYRSAGKSKMNRELWEHESTYWPHFRDRDTTCALIPVPASVRLDLHAGFELVRRLVFTDKRLNFRWQTPVFESLLYQNPPYDKVLEHPLMKAAIYVVVMMERTKRRDRKERTHEPIYGNLR